MFPFGWPLFGAASGALSTDVVLSLMAMVSGSVVPEVPPRCQRVRGCSEAGMVTSRGARRPCLWVFSTCGGAVGGDRLLGAEDWSGVMIMGNRLLTWHSGMEWEGEVELDNILAVWSATASCYDLKYEGISVSDELLSNTNWRTHGIVI